MNVDKHINQVSKCICPSVAFKHCSKQYLTRSWILTKELMTNWKQGDTHPARMGRLIMDHSIVNCRLVF